MCSCFAVPVEIIRDHLNPQSGHGAHMVLWVNKHTQRVNRPKAAYMLYVWQGMRREKKKSKNRLKLDLVHGRNQLVQILNFPVEGH